MNLLEVMMMYQENLQQEGREAGERFLRDVLDDEFFPVVLPHIVACFNDEGQALSAHVAFETPEGGEGRRSYTFE